MPTPLKEFPHDSYDEAYYQTILAEEVHGALSYRWRMRWLDELLRPGPGDRVLDVGSGAGVVSRHLARRGAEVEAVDLAEAAVAVARRASEGLAVRYTVADAARCDHLAADRFDKITCCDLIEHVHDDVMRGVFREALRLLRPGGLLFVYSPNASHWIERLKARNFILKNPVGHIRVRRTREVVAALEGCGFEIARVARPASMLPVVRWLEWLWIRLPICPALAIYRVCLLARKPAAP